MEKKSRIVLWFTAGVLLTMLIFSVLTHEQPPVAVKTAAASCQSIYNSILAKGNVEVLESKSLSCGEAAIVKKIYVKEGDNVKKGQTLLILQTTQTPVSLTDDQLSGLTQEVMDGNITSSEDMEQVLSTFLPSGVVPSSGGREITITSPMDGTVMKAPDGEGAQIFPGISYMKISDLNKLRVRAKIPEMYIGQIKKGQSANITGDALEGKTYSAQVQSIMPYAAKTVSLTGQGNQSYVESILSMSGGSGLRPGYTVDVKIFTDRQDKAVLVPYEAVTQVGSQEYVYVLKNGRAVQRAVTTGYELENLVQIEKGVESNDIVVLDPPENLKNGDKIKLAGVE